MSSGSYNLVFSGDVIAGQDPEQVKQRIANLLKLDPKKADALFSGRRVVLKRGLDFEKAKKFRDLFEKAGAILAIEVSEAFEPPPVPETPEADSPKIPDQEAVEAEKAAGEKAIETPPPYLSPKGRVTAITVFIVLYSAVSLFALVEAFNLIKLILRLMEAKSAGLIPEITANLKTLDTLRIVNSFLYLAAGIGFMSWLYRSNKNLRALGARAVNYSPAWAAWSCIVPIAGLFVPYLATKEIWRASDPEIPIGDGLVWKEAKPPVLLPLWWWGFIIPSILAIYVPNLASKAKYLVLFSWLNFFQTLLFFIGGILFIVVVRKVTAMQEEKRRIIESGSPA